MCVNACDSQRGAVLFATDDNMDDDDDDDLFAVMSKSSKTAKSVSEFLTSLFSYITL